MILYYFSNSATNLANLTGTAIFTEYSTNSGNLTIDGATYISFLNDSTNTGTIVGTHPLSELRILGGTNYAAATVGYVSLDLGGVNYGTLNVSSYMTVASGSTNNGTISGSGVVILLAGSTNTGTILSAEIQEGAINTGTILASSVYVAPGGGGSEFTALSTINTVYYVSGANMTWESSASAEAVLYTDEELTTTAGAAQFFVNLAGGATPFNIDGNGVLTYLTGAFGGLYYINGQPTNLDGGGNSAVYDNPPNQGGFSYSTFGNPALFYQGGVPFTGSIAATTWEAIYDEYGAFQGYNAAGNNNTVGFVNGVPV